jgi:serine/threonine protein kinase
VEICAGVNHLHEKRILHRDLKPANVFVGERGELKVGDLGLGRPLSDQTLMANSKVGTPLYMAPDILDGKSYDYKCDVWSLGCLLFELAALISPFKQSGISLMELCTNIKTGVPANTIPCYYSKSLHTLAGAMLSVDPDARPAVATVLPQATAMLARWTVGHAAAQRPRLPTPPTTVASAGQGMRRGRSICKSKSTKGSTQNSNRSVNDSEKVWRIKHQLPHLGEFMGERDMASLLSSCRACKCALCSFRGLEPKHQQQHQQQHQQVPEKQAATAKKGGLVGDMDEPSMEDINKLGNYARRRSKECEASESVHDSSRAHDNSSGGDSDLGSSRSGSASGSLTGTCTVSSSGIDAGASSSRTAGGNSSMLTGAPTPKYSKTQNLSLAPDIVRRDNGKHAAMVKAASLIPSLPAASMSMSSRALSNFGSNGKGNKVGKGTGISARPRLTTTLPTTSSTAIRAAALAAASTDTSTLDLSPPITAAKGSHDMISSSVGPGAPLPLPRRPRTPPRNRQVQLVGKSGRAPGGGAPRGGARRPSNGRRLLRLRSEPTKVAAMGVPHPPAITA